MGAIGVSVSNANTDISTDGDVTLHGNGIGASNSLDIGLDADGGTLTVDSNGSSAVDIDGSAANGFSAITITQSDTANNIDIENSSSTDVVDIDGAAGGVTLTSVVMTSKDAAFSYTLEEGSQTTGITNIDADAGTVTVIGTGDVTITADGGVTSTGTGAVSITSSGGAIKNSGTSNTAADISLAGGSLTLSAAGVIADSSDAAGLDVDTDGGALDVTHSGGAAFIDYEGSTGADTVSLTVSATGGSFTYASSETGLLTLAS